MKSDLRKRKAKLQDAWGVCREDRVVVDGKEIFLLDGPVPVVGDPENPPESTRTLWFAPVNVHGRQEYRGRAVYFDLYPKRASGLTFINHSALDYGHRKKEAIKDAMEFMKRRDG